MILEAREISVPENLDQATREILGLAKKEQTRLHSDQISTIHLWLGLVHPESPFTRELSARNIDLTGARASIEAVTGYGTALPTDEFDLTKDAKAVLILASERAQEEGGVEITQYHLYQALARHPDYINHLLLMEAVFKVNPERQPNQETYSFFQGLWSGNNIILQEMQKMSDVYRITETPH